MFCFSLRYGLKVGLLLAVSCCAANALHIEVKERGNWIWFSDGQPNDEKPSNNSTQATAESNGKVTLDSYKYYTSTSSYIDSITLDGSSSLAAINTNKTFTIGTLTLQGETSMAVAGSWDATKCSASAQCAYFNVENLILDSTKDKTITLRRVKAKNTTITGNGTINIGEKGRDNSNAKNETNLGNVIIEKSTDSTNGTGVTIKSASDAEAEANSITIKSGAKLTFNGIDGKMQVGIIDIKNGGEIDKQNGTNGELTVTNIVAEAGAKGLDKITAKNLIITAIKSGSIADFLSDTPTETDLGTGAKTANTTIKHNSVDNGLFKYGGDFVTQIAQDNGTYKAITSTANLNIEASDRFQASLDNAYLAHHILLSNTMAINSKLFFFDSFKSNAELQRANQTKGATIINANNPESSEDKVESHIDSWVNYEYSNISQYGNALNANAHSVQLGVGYLQTNKIKSGGFFRYTYLGTDNKNIGNKYATHAYNAGLYGVANMWSNGYFRGQIAYSYIDSKGDYSLRNDMTGTNISGALKDSFHYLTTSIGIAQEGVISNMFWGSVAFDIAHIVPLLEKTQFDEYSFSKNSVTIAALSGAFGVKIFDTMLYATGQVGYVMSSKDREIDLRQRAESDFYSGGTATTNAQWQQDFGIINDYKYNMIVGDLGVGVAYNFTRAFKGSLYVGAGFYSSSKPHIKANGGLSYLF